MKKTVSIFNRHIVCSVLCSFLSSVPIVLIPVAKGNEDNKVFAVMIPIIFWLGLTGEQFFIWRANFYRKKLQQTNGRYPKRIRGRPGVISFFMTLEGMAADLLFLVSLIVFVVIALLHKGESVLQFILIFCLILSFRLHCTFNGINYRYKKILTEVGKRDVQHN